MIFYTIFCWVEQQDHHHEALVDLGRDNSDSCQWGKTAGKKLDKGGP